MHKALGSIITNQEVFVSELPVNWKEENLAQESTR